MVKWGYAPFFLGQSGIWAKQSRARRPHVLQTAPNSVLTRKQDVRRPCRARTPLFFFSSTLLGLTGPRRTRGLRNSPFWPHVGGVCPRKSTKFMYYPRVTILHPHLTEIIPLHEHLCQTQKQLQTHLHVTVYNIPNSPRAEQPAVASIRDRFLREIIHQEQNSIWNQIFD